METSSNITNVYHEKPVHPALEAVLLSDCSFQWSGFFLSYINNFVFLTGYQLRTMIETEDT
jgi:hypothetical protein